MSDKRTHLGYFQCLAIAWAISFALIFLAVKCAPPANAQTAPPAPCYMQITPSKLEGPPPDFEWVPGDRS